MPKVTYVQQDGSTRTIDGAIGVSVMETAKKNGVPGIDADCGGGCSCGTCHVYVDPDWFTATGPPTALEEATLEFSVAVQENSRLSCQLKLSDKLDGLVVHLPTSQR